eukprot:TRINITY_DN1384_c0_g1_i3.p1 TRINITY_DN1384_c0_g1~~TRINITY_DN1384_c0_g1_i3.p1  ORF type:complete len:313 (+),score=56.27 TRINITY_DN1384_c0_g1_i3:41-979(+)
MDKEPSVYLSDQIIAAALSSLVKVPIFTKEEYAKRDDKGGEIDMENLHKMSLQTHEGKQKIDINASFLNIKILNSDSCRVPVSPSDSVLDIKKRIEQEKGIPHTHLKALFCGRTLNNDENVGNLKLLEGTSLFVIHEKKSYQLESKWLYPEYHYDFSKIVDRIEVFRGGERYFRPCGWYRYGLYVLDRPSFGNNVWLGAPGSRIESTEGEWPVTYHGTGTFNSQTMSDYAFSKAQDQEKLHPNGVYTTNDPKTAAKFAQTFEYNGKTYELIVHNRVNPANKIEIVDGNEKYYCHKDPYDVRPYGFCVREKKH